LFKNLETQFKDFPAEFNHSGVEFFHIAGVSLKKPLFLLIWLPE
jgi:hypothetical protein